MINYSPISGDPSTAPIIYRPRTCFLMTQLGGEIAEEVHNIRDEINRVLENAEFDMIDASSAITGRDFLLKIWEMIVAVPLGVAIIHQNMPTRTLCNIFYEIGMAQSLGKETIIVKTKGADIPSDFVRTEYVVYNREFKNNFAKYVNGVIDERQGYYEQMADLLENNPLLSIDYLRRAYLISGDVRYRDRVKSIFKASQLEERARNSVEALLAQF